MNTEGSKSLQKNSHRQFQKYSNKTKIVKQNRKCQNGSGFSRLQKQQKLSEHEKCEKQGLTMQKVEKQGSGQVTKGQENKGSKIEVRMKDKTIISCKTLTEYEISQKQFDFIEQEQEEVVIQVNKNIKVLHSSESEKYQTQNFEFQQINEESKNDLVFKDNRQNYFKNLSSFSSKLEGIDNLLKKLKENKIEYCHVYADKLKKNVYQNINNSIRFAVYVGHFQFQVNLLKVHYESTLLSKKVISTGNYSSVYELEILQKTYAIKSQEISTKDRQELNEKLDSIIEEFLYYKIASILQFGPYLSNAFGYDIICYNNSIEFAMEICYKNKDRENIEKELKQNLLKMHKLKIVHRDIKNDNISWSPHFQRWIFLDFGFAKLLKQKIGEKTWTRFIGTLRWTIPQLNQIYFLKKKRKVDFYTNDLFGLQKSIEELKGSSIKIEQILSMSRKDEEKGKVAENNTLEGKSSQKQEKMLSELKMQEIIEQIKQFESNFYEIDLRQQFFTYFIKIKYYLFSDNYQEVQNLLQSNQDGRQIYLHLMIREYQKVERSENKQKLLQLFKRYTQIVKRTNDQKQEIQFLKKYIDQEEFKDLKQWQGTIFYFQSEKDLQIQIKKGWSSLKFKQKLLFFMNEMKFTFSIKLFERLKLVCDIVGRNYFEKSEEKRWFWKYTNILYKLEEEFKREVIKNLKCLTLIQMNYKTIQNIQRSLKLQKQISHYFDNRIKIIVTEFLMTMSQINRNKMRQFYEGIVRETDNEENNVWVIVIGTVMEISQKCYLSEEDNSKIEELKGQCCEALQRFNIDYCLQFAQALNFWRYNFFCKYYNEEINIMNISPYFNEKGFKDREIKIKSKDLSSHFRLKEKKVIFASQLPTIMNIQENYHKNKEDKAKQMVEDLLQMWKQELFLYPYEVQQFLKIGNFKAIYLSQILESFKVSFLQNLQNKHNYIEECLQFLIVIGPYYYDQNQTTEELVMNKQFKKMVRKVNVAYEQGQFHDEQKMYKILMKIYENYLHNKLQQTVQEYIIVFTNTFKHRKQWKNKCIELVISFISIYDSLIDESQVVKQKVYGMAIDIWRSVPQNQINWFLKTSYSLALIKSLCYSDMVVQAYETLKSFTSYLTALNQQIDLSQPFKIFVQYSQLQRLHQLLITKTSQHSHKRIYDQIRNNNFLSALTFMMFLRCEHILTQTQKKKSLVLTMLSMDKFPCYFKLILRNTLIIKQKIIQFSKGRRKKMIVCRRQAYATSISSLLQEKLLKKCKYEQSLQKNIKDKIIKIKGNLK